MTEPSTETVSAATHLADAAETAGAKVGAALMRFERRDHDGEIQVLTITAQGYLAPLLEAFVQALLPFSHIQLKLPEKKP